MENKEETVELVVNENIGRRPSLNGNQWKVCCGGSTDRRVLTFIASLSLSLIVMIFSCYQLTQDLNCSQENIYVGFITFLMGFWVKSPLS